MVYTVNMRRAHHGFALPTVLIAGTLMLIVLTSALVAATSIRSTVQQQYYDQLAREAAESGLVQAKACVEGNDFDVTWDDSKPLQPNTDCNGDETASCAASANTVGCSVVTGTEYVTSYKVYPSYDAATHQLILKSEGNVSRIRQSSSTIMQLHSYTQYGQVDLGVMAAEYIESGHLMVCGIFDGQTWCWGSNLNGRLGNGLNEDTYTLTPIKMFRLSGGLLGKTDKMVSVSNGTTCVVTTDNQIYCTGRGNAGQIGDGTNNDRTTVRQVSKPAGMTGNITQITAFGGGFCAISAGDLWCWGSGSYGKIGNGSTSNRNIPTKVSVIGATASPSRPVTYVASDSEAPHVCAIAQVSGAGKAYCWGHNMRGALGDNSTTNRTTPTAVYASGVLSGKNLVKIGVSGRYPDLMVNDNQYPSDAQVVSCANSQGDNLNKRKCARTGQACALDTDGKMYCWGANQYGQLGGGSGDTNYSTNTPQWRRTVPIQVTTGGLDSKTITDMAVARPATCALVGSENIVYCWGGNDRGIIGRGNAASNGQNYPDAASIAVQTPGIQGQTIERLTAGLNRFCVITTIKNVYCWGVGGTAGQIGDGAKVDRNVPTEATMLKKLRKPIIY